MIRHDERPIDGTDVPIMWQAVSGGDAHIDELCGWLATRHQEVEKLIYRHGGVLLRGFDCLRGASDFQRALDALGLELMDYVDGSAPRHAVSGRIMTTIDLSCNYSVPLHQEMAYTDGAPDIIAFFCETPAPVGGETTVGDMRRITRSINPEVIERFETHQGLQVRRSLPPPDKVASWPGIPRSWAEVFGTTDPAEAERIVVKSGWRSEWLGDGSMRLWQDVRPAMRTHPHTGERVWFNQVHRFSPIGMLKRARDDNMEEMAKKLEHALAKAPDQFDRMFHGDGTPVADEDVAHIYDVLAENAIPVGWQRGDLIILDNTLVAHGRRIYSGDRLILTALIRTEPVAAERTTSMRGAA
jgi:alpha-ketoglutarate-dependent taurine dioxygenase